MKGMLVRFGVVVALLVGSAAPQAARAADEAAEVYPFACLALPGDSPESYVDKFPGNDLLPYTADDIDVPEGGNPAGTWGFSHFDLNSDNKVDADEHIFVVAAGGGEFGYSHLYSAASRPEYGVIYEAEDWRSDWEARLEGPTTLEDHVGGETDFELNDWSGWCGESNAFVYNNLGANQHGLGLAKYSVDYRKAPAAGQSFVYDEISGFLKTFGFRNVFDDPNTPFNEKGDCRRWYKAQNADDIELKGYLIPVADLPGLKDGSLPTLFGWEDTGVVDLAKYLRETIGGKLAHDDLKVENGDAGPIGGITHIYLCQMQIPFDVSDANGECGGTGQEPCASDPNPGLCQVQNHASYWGISPPGASATYRGCAIMGFNDAFTDVAFGGDVHKWLDAPDDSSRRNLWLQDHFWRDDQSHLGKYTLEPGTTAWTIIKQPDVDHTVYDNTNDFVIVSSGAGSISGPLPKPLPLGETPIEAVADLSEDVTPPPPAAGAGGGVAAAFQIILRDGNNVVAYADISAGATKVHIGGTYDPATGLAGSPKKSSSAVVGAIIGETNADPAGSSAEFTRFVLRVTPTEVSLRQAASAEYTTKDFLDLDTLGESLASVSADENKTIDFKGGVNTLTIGSAGRAAINTLLVFASPGTGPFIRGRVNGDNNLDLSDAVALFGFLFLGKDPPACKAAADANGDGKLDLSDGVYDLNFLFLGRAQPPAPYPDAAFSQKDGDKLLGCQTPIN